jgi:hypothetical protein
MSENLRPREILSPRDQKTRRVSAAFLQVKRSTEGWQRPWTQVVMLVSFTDAWFSSASRLAPTGRLS